MKKRILTMLLTASLLVSFAACGAEEKSEEASSETVSEVVSEAVSEEKSEEESEEKSEEVSKEEQFMAYTEDKSGYLSNVQTKNLNFNSINIKARDFKGTFKDCHIDENGRLTIDSKPSLFNASFESEVMNVGSFRTMLISWNAVCGNGKIEVLTSFEVEGGEWSDYFTYGTWTDKNLSSTSKSVTNDFGTMNVDTLIPSKKTTGNVKYKINIRRSGIYLPVIENITIATSEMNRSAPGEYPDYFYNPVPMRSQYAPENGADGGVMCSATTTAMGLEYMGFNQSTLATAKRTWDKEFGGYGNWLFCVAEAASHGYYTFCDFYTEDMIKYALSQGYAIGCSTYLSTVGHIVLLVGYETVDGVDYYIVNDPGVSSSNPQITRYTCEYFNSVWMEDRYSNTGVVYVFQGKY